MPYKIIETPKGYFVENITTNKRYSKRPMTKDNAIMQLYILRSHIHEDNMGNMGNISGEGFIDSVKDRFSGFTDGLRLDFPPREREFIIHYGNYQIVDIVIARAPIKSYIDAAINALSFGKWNNLKQKYSFDSLFHLYAILKLQKENEIVIITIEKNEVISISTDFKVEANAQLYQLVVNKQITLNELLQNAIQVMKPERFFTYSPWHNNCQIFLLGLFGASDLLNDQSKQFIFQNIDNLVKELPQFTKSIGQTITDTAHKVNILIKGKGIF